MRFGMTRPYSVRGMRFGMNCFGMNCFGMNCFGMNCFGMNCFGMNCFGLTHPYSVGGMSHMKVVV
jgi:hypothetical protein